MNERKNATFPEETYRSVYSLILRLEKPVAAEDLNWEVNYGSTSNQYNSLGPRSRRRNLYTILGDFRDEGLIVFADGGIDLPYRPHSDIDQAIGSLMTRGLVQSEG